MSIILAPISGGVRCGYSNTGCSSTWVASQYIYDRVGLVTSSCHWLFFSLCLPICFSGYVVHLRCTSEGGSLVSVCCPAVLLSLLSGLYRVHGLRVSSLCHVARWHFLPPFSFHKVFVIVVLFSLSSLPAYVFRFYLWLIGQFVPAVSLPD